MTRKAETVHSPEGNLGVDYKPSLSRPGNFPCHVSAMELHSGHAIAVAGPAMMGKTLLASHLNNNSTCHPGDARKRIEPEHLVFTLSIEYFIDCPVKEIVNQYVGCDLL